MSYEDKKNIFGIGVEVIDGHMLIPCATRNAICWVNMDNQQSMIIYHDKDEELAAEYLWGHVARIGDIVLVTPFYGNKIVLFKYLKASAQIELLREISIESNVGKRGKFLQIHTYKDDFFLIGHYFPGIIKINKNTFEITVLDSWVKELQEMGFPKNENDFFVYEGAAIFENELFVPLGFDSMLLKVDMRTEKTTLICLACEKMPFGGMVADGDFLWIKSFEPDSKINRLVVWNRHTNETKILAFESKGTWNSPIIFGNEIKLIPSNDLASAYAIDRNTMEVKRDKWLKSIISKDFELKYSVASSIEIKNEKIFMVMWPSYEYVYQTEEAEFMKQKFLLEKADFDDKYKNAHVKKITIHMKTAGNVVDEAQLELEKYIDYVCEED